MRRLQARRKLHENKARQVSPPVPGLRTLPAQGLAAIIVHTAFIHGSSTGEGAHPALVRPSSWDMQDGARFTAPCQGIAAPLLISSHLTHDTR